MGRRKKAAKKVVKKKRPTVARVFKCLFCNNDKSVQCTINQKTATGKLHCTLCDADFETRIHSLTDPIDIFTEWLDEATEQQRSAMQQQRSRISSDTGPASASDAEEIVVEGDSDDGKEEGSSDEEEVVESGTL